MVTACLTDSTKLIPYIVGNRKIVKAYLKTCLGFWSSPNLDTSKGDDEDAGSTDEEDRVRIAAFLGIRRVALGNDAALLDLVLKASCNPLIALPTNVPHLQGAYSTLVRSSRATNVHSLPAINLMKNTAVDLYSIDPAASYQHAFGYIRQLAVTLRNTLKAIVTGPQVGTVQNSNNCAHVLQ
jgi:nucleolar complex protein 2